MRGDDKIRDTESRSLEHNGENLMHVRRGSPVLRCSNVPCDAALEVSPITPAFAERKPTAESVAGVEDLPGRAPVLNHCAVDSPRCQPGRPLTSPCHRAASPVPCPRLFAPRTVTKGLFRASHRSHSQTKKLMRGDTRPCRSADNYSCSPTRASGPTELGFSPIVQLQWLWVLLLLIHSRAAARSRRGSRQGGEGLEFL